MLYKYIGARTHSTTNSILMAYRRTDRMQQRVDERRQSILHAAEKTICEKGFESTTMKDITRAAGTSIGNLYFYFPNKDDLMMRLI